MVAKWILLFALTVLPLLPVNTVSGDFLADRHTRLARERQANRVQRQYYYSQGQYYINPYYTSPAYDYTIPGFDYIYLYSRPKDFYDDIDDNGGVYYYGR